MIVVRAVCRAPLPPPPFGKRLRWRIQCSDAPANGVWLWCGADAWRRAKQDEENARERGILALPPRHDPLAFDWSVVAGFDVLVCHTGGLTQDALALLAISTVRAGAAMALVVGEHPAPLLPLYRPRTVPNE